MIKKIILVTLLSLFVFLLPFTVRADTEPTGWGGASEQLNNAVGGLGLQQDLPTSAGNIIKVVLSLIGTIFLVLTVYAGVLWMTAAGNSEQVTKAQSIVVTAIIGLFVVLSAYAITYFVTAKLGG